ncbi:MULTISPECIES: DEAD/DEAH box helicase family protein [unclassified Variovorax]|uniref:DEAD/DEAH box helicase family protein n=1 Tax=unclassified Variovorax TaxID=663243 RepID=UPI0025756F6C|nr:MULTISPECIES: DEAD/DEAH box helicase family protein [unclassified Variovorax]MDM0091589.1 DEAD/DEAH box helicase family protein [Variovorax sp. J22G40]MDM0148791.1 DEAD/DEAH box helicase family protein [Variovorax sp. J2P1-31]
MSLQSIKPKISYRSDAGNVVDDFYVPCMTNAVLYRRAVGYFTSGSLSLAARGAARLIKSGGKIQLITSPQLSAEDTEAIEKGYESRGQRIRKLFETELEQLQDELERERLNALAWLISINALEIKLALRVDPRTGKLGRGIYHEKIGVFEDSSGAMIAFTGSQNETTGGLVSNFESIDVYWSWDDPHGRTRAKAADFDDLWAGAPGNPALLVEDFTEIAKEVLAKFRRDQPPEFDPDEEQVRRTKRGPRSPQIPETIRLQDHQLLGIRNWVAAGGKGVLQMATGAGKTITALAAAVRLYEQMGLQALIVVCPYRHLVQQWCREAESFGFDPLLAFESINRWAERLTAQLNDVHSGTRKFMCVLTTNSTFSSDSFQSRLRYFPATTFIVGDEVHNLGSENLASALPEKITLRLGLSATPERWFDLEGTARIFNYFGPVIEPKFTLKMALNKGVLVPYRYIPILIELDDDERERYLEISAKIAKLWNADAESTSLKFQLLERGRLVASARNKLVALTQLFSSTLQGQSHFLVYCGDGTVETETDLGVARQVDEAMRLLGSDLGMRVSKYTADENLDQREVLRKGIDDGTLQGLVAIRCLDEGVDIPSIQTAIILASSSNPRQFIQRRGRVLRRAPGKDAAVVYDMVVVPPEEGVVGESERSLLRKELVRFVEFADLAINSGEARATILPLQKKFNLMDL